MQHQAYQPVLPCVNKYLQYRWDKNCYEMHRNKLEEERVSRIERENQMLLDKMTHIMQTNGGVDCRNDYVKKSLGSERRLQELFHITKENQRILQRLSTCRPRHSVQEWREQWLRNLQLMENIGRYPRHTAQRSSLPPISADRH
ncbi:sperm axonemal maintenance protein CFAP97D1 isoform X3 [Siphateles boraxobius]|uniref:sperm axonemal maintenance protein CFAP97D1 isoform X3 n=1 Tax=Siphateles boraxobius TaxID=180520 RepID=UPI004063B2BD